MTNKKSKEKEDKIAKIENKLDNITNLLNKFMDATINKKIDL